MSLLLCNRAQIGQNGVATRNFVLDSTAADGTMKLARGNAGATTQDILTVDATGFVSAGAGSAPQFDATAKLATTAFARAIGQNYNGAVQYASGGAISSADMGKVHFCNGAGLYNLTLPLSTSVPAGASFTIMGVSSGSASIVRQGSDLIVPQSTGVTAIVVNNGDALTFVSGANGNWYVFGSSQLKYSAGFGASLGASGYQKLPSGLIIQWGNGSSGNLAITFPIAFPTSPIGVWTQAQSTGNGNYNTNASLYSATGFSIYPSAGGAGTTFAYNWMAIGY